MTAAIGTPSSPRQSHHLALWLLAHRDANHRDTPSYSPAAWAKVPTSSFRKRCTPLREEDGSSITLRRRIHRRFRACLHPERHEQLAAAGEALYHPGRPFAASARRPAASASQIDCEILGEDDPAADVEIMMLAMFLFRDLGFQELTFQFNSTGCRVCKPGYILDW